MDVSKELLEVDTGVGSVPSLKYPGGGEESVLIRVVTTEEVGVVMETDTMDLDGVVRVLRGGNNSSPVSSDASAS